MNKLKSSIDLGQIALQNYLERAVALHPLPWNAAKNGQNWGVVASDGFRVVEDCADWAEAQAIVNCRQEAGERELELLAEASAPR